MSELPEGWTSTTLGAITRIEKGSTITKKAARPGRVPVIAGGQKPAYFHDKANRAANTITVSASGAYAGYVSFHDEPIYASDCSTVQNLNDELSSIHYLRYFMQAKQQEVYALQRGSGMPHVYAKDLALLEVPLPPLDIQQRIVETLEDHLSRLDKAVKELDVAHEESDALLRSWLHSEFYPRFQNNEVTSLSELADTRLGKMLDAAKNEGELTFYLRNANVQWERFDLEEVSQAPMTDKDRVELMLADGDVLICEGGVPGRSAVWEGRLFGEEAIGFQKALHRVRVGEALLPNFLVLVLRYLATTEQLDAFTTGTTIKHLPQEQLRRLPIPNFSLEEQSDLIAAYERLQELIAHATTTVSRLRNQILGLRRSLLHAAFTGQLTNEDSND